MPVFVVPGTKIKEEISSMPGIYRYSVDKVFEEINEIKDCGIKAIILFGVPEKKDSVGSEAYSENGIIQKGIRAIKEKQNDILVITDVCLCEYTDHGHCGIIKNQKFIDNDATLELLAKQALSHVEAGADIVAPSDMMDGRVKKIREILDANSYLEIPILSYATKYASAFYGPFREAVHSAPKFQDRKSYQMDYRRSKDYIDEAYLDIEEGADIIMVKPALAYLDVIKILSTTLNVPIACYNVSGEYTMIKHASSSGYIDEKNIILETLTSMKRAGASIIITYFAKEVSRLL
jgi:porphobilinogen synthase